MPIHEFECIACGERFERLVSSGTAAGTCPRCGDGGSRRLLSRFAVLGSTRPSGEAAVRGPCGSDDCACRRNG